MNSVAEYLDKLEVKIVQLAEDHKKTITERDQLTRQASIDKKIIEEQNIEIENLKNQVQALKIAKSVESREETDKVKAKIQDLVREIDRCIELLNK